MNEENKTESLNPRNLPIIEETSLNDIVLRVRDWQETIDKKFNRKHAYLDFGNEEVNDYKKELLEKGEVDESDVFQNNPEWFHVVKREGKFVDLSNFLFVDINSHDNISKFSATNCECVLDYEEDKNIDFEMVLNFVSINLEDNYIFNKKVELFNCRISIVQTNYPFKLIFEKELNVISTEIDVEGSVELHFNNTCNFNLCTFENMICKLEINGIYNIENCVFKKSIHLLNTVINAKSNFSNVSFEKNIYIDGPIEINNLLYISKLKDTQRDIKIKEKLKYSLVFSYSELYD